MKKLLLLSILLIVGCEEASQHGCLDSQACNYDSGATIDNNSCAYEVDCEGVCGGSASYSDECDTTECMNELEVESCSELEELYELHQQAYNDYLNSTSCCSELAILNENATTAHSCLESSCPNSSLLE